MEKPFPAYRGDDPYVFVCYAHADAALVYQDIARLRDGGINVWYDEGIVLGSEWSESLAEAIVNSAAVVFFVSPTSERSQHCRREINYAISHERPIATVFLEPTELSGGLELSLSNRQAIMRYDLAEDEYAQKLLGSLNTEHSMSFVPASPRPPSQRRAAIAIGVALLVSAAAVWWSARTDNVASTTSQPAAATTPSIAVLPFMKIGNVEDYFADGLAEQLLNTLAGLGKLQVASRTAAFFYKQNVQTSSINLAEISGALGVQYVLEGSVQRAGPTLRVTAQLTDTGSGFNKWSKTYDTNSMDVLVIQDNIASSVAAEIAEALNLTLPEPAEPATRNLEAFDYLLRATEHLRAATPDGLNKAMDLFEQAVAADPEYADAHAGLCQVWRQRHARHRLVQDLANADVACEKAMVLGADRWQVRLAMDALQISKGRYQAAISDLTDMLQSDQGTAEVHRTLAFAFERAGEFDRALEHYQAAVTAEPGYWNNHDYLGGYYYERSQYSRALDAFERAAELAPMESRPLIHIAIAQQMLGDLDGAEATLGRSLQIAPSPLAATNLGVVYYYSARVAEAQRMFRIATSLSPEDYRIWARLCDAALVLDDAEARDEACSRAVVLAQIELGINTNRPDIRADLAFYLAATGRVEQSERNFADAIREDPGNATTHFLVAIAHWRDGRSELALQSLQVAIDNGLSRQMVATEPLLAGLSSDARFENLIAE